MEEQFNELLKLNPFKIFDIDELNHGGQKFVFKGKNEHDELLVLKIVVCNNEIKYKRAIREIECTNKVGCIHIPKIYKYESINYNDNRLIFILEQFIQGTTLRRMLDINKRIPEKEIYDIGRQILYILSDIHDNNLVHRDVKPENIIITDSKEVYLLDLGIVRDLDDRSLTSDFAIFGPMSLGYAAPEQIQNDKYEICNRTDIYSWGVIMYEMFSGSNPFKSIDQESNEIITKMLKYVPPKLNLKSDILSEVIQKCLSKAVHRRPKSCKVILNLLKGEI